MATETTQVDLPRPTKYPITEPSFQVSKFVMWTQYCHKSNMRVVVSDRYLGGALGLHGAPGSVQLGL